MAAPIGNQFWKNRSKHGRDTLFASADKLWEAATEYFDWVDENPWVRIEQSKRPTVTKDTLPDGTQLSTVHDTVELPNARPYTLKGLCLYLNCGEAYFRQFKESKNLTDDFSTIITRIEDVIFTQKFEGAAVGAFNANIIARELGLADRQEVVAAGVHRVRRDEESGDIVIEQVTE